MATIALGMDQALWVKRETTQNTAAWPAAADFVPVIGDAQFKQKPEKVDSNERVMSYSRTGRDVTGYLPGDFSFEMKVRPSGTAGTAPIGDPIYESLLGKKTVVSETSVTYDPAEVGDPVVTFSALVKDGHEVSLCTGCYISKATFPIVAETGEQAIGKTSLSGGFLRKYRAGTDMLNAEITGTVGSPITAIVLKTADAYKRYDVGAKIVVGTDDNDGAGYVISAITAATNTLTITGGVVTTQAANAVVKGWTPAITSAGVTTLGAFGLAQMAKGEGAYANLAITEASVEIDNGIHALYEKDNTWFPSAIAYGKRTVSVNLKRFFYEDGGDYEYDSVNQVAIGVKLPSGNTAGERYRLELPNCEADSPDLSGDMERMLGLPLQALATAALDDEVSLIFD